MDRELTISICGGNVVSYTYKAGSLMVDYAADENEKVSVEDATAMALIDIAAQLKRLNGQGSGIERALDNISNAADSISQSVG
jgi:hypothetical protein